MRILLCPVEIAGYMGRLKSGFQQHGVETKFIDISDNPMRYEGADSFYIAHATQQIRRLRKRLGRIGLCLLPLEVSCRFFLLAYSLLWPDVVIFCFGNTFLGGCELPLYRLFRVKTVFVYLGSDSRPYYLNGASASKARGISIKECYESTQRQKQRLLHQERYADYVIDHPPSGVFHEKAFYPFLLFGMPIPKIATDPVILRAVNKDYEVIVLHAPSFPECKGSAKIREMMDNIIASGRRCRYVELSGRPNSEVLEALRECDFVVDELYSDSVLAGLGAEAAMAGKPTVVGSYAEDAWLGVPHDMIPPAFRATASHIEDLIKSLLDEPARVSEKGAAVRTFVTDKWSTKSVAGRYLSMLRGELTEYRYDPGRIPMTMGWGFSESGLRVFLREYIGHFGPSALFLDDKPALRDRLLAFAEKE